MAEFGQTFDANSVDPAAPRDVIPPGKYLIQIVKSDMRPTKDGAGKYLELEFDVLDGDFKGRKLWDRLNLVNNNEEAANIAQRTLSAICHATGQLVVSNSETLHLKPIIGTVKVRPAGPDRNGVQRDAQNELRGYERADNGSGVGVGGAAPRRSYAAASGGFGAPSGAKAGVAAAGAGASVGAGGAAKAPPPWAQKK